MDSALQPFDNVVGFRGTEKRRMRTGQKKKVLYIQYVVLLLTDSMFHRV